ncbi:MAG: tetraacyldisaccharide 4'-kinase [Acidobacteriota bacterium]
MNILSSIYGAAAARRRQYYRRDPAHQRRLRRPVISVGNLSVGGAGKTPLVAAIARLLVERGERPAILSRGYGRSRPQDGVTVVSDGAAVLAPVESAGDEPLMLARALPGVPVLVAADRYLSGRLAEEKLGARVHLLDDGFQHLQLWRDVDLLAVSEDDLHDIPLPGGRLREARAAAADADAALVDAGYLNEAERIGRLLGLPTAFMVVRTLGPPRLIASGDTVVVPANEPVFAVAGIARPERFFGDLASAGWRVAGTMRFRDHHRFSNRDVARVAAAARAAGARLIMTTEKDAVRLTGKDFGPIPAAAVPLVTAIEPSPAFADWLIDRLQAVRAPVQSNCPAS